MKQKYLQEIRKRMFWRFKGSDIREVLEELDMYFETAEEEGLTQEQFVDRYGAPRDLVREMMEAQAIPAKEQSRNRALKVLVIMVYLLLMFFSYFLIGTEFAVGMSLIFLSILVWNLSGNEYYLRIEKLRVTSNKALYFSQICFWCLVIFMQICVIWLIPYLFRNINSIKILGNNLYLGIKISILISIFLLMSCVWNMFKGKVYLFFAVMELISMLYSLFLYAIRLKSSEELSDLSFIFYPCIITAVILLFYWLFVFKKGLKNGCTNKKGHFGDVSAI